MMQDTNQHLGASQEQVRSMQHATETMKIKAKEYLQRIEMYKKQLEENGFDKKISHNEIKRIYLMHCKL